MMADVILQVQVSELGLVEDVMTYSFFMRCTWNIEEILQAVSTQIDIRDSRSADFCWDAYPLISSNTTSTQKMQSVPTISITLGSLAGLVDAFNGDSKTSLGQNALAPASYPFSSLCIFIH